MAQSRMPTSYLDRLPLELISMIFKNLGYDLVAHVTFSILRSDIYDFCYSSLDAEFWQRILRASGLATLNLAEGNIECQTRDEWELLARECVQHAEVCTHPKCGMVRIRQNEEAVRKSLNHGVDLMHTTFSTDNPNDTATLQELHILEFSPVWDGIAFKKARAGSTKKWQSAAFVRPAEDDSEDDSEDDTEDDAKDDDTLQYGDELVEHPVLWRSFATFPPVTDFTMLLHENARMEPYNSDGVIVADVLQNILDIDKQLRMHNLDFVGLIESTLGSREQLVPRSWTLSDTLSALGDFTDWLILVRWVGLKPRSILENMVICEMEVKTQELPDRYGDFFHLTTYY